MVLAPHLLIPLFQLLTLTVIPWEPVSHARQGIQEAIFTLPPLFQIQSLIINPIFAIDHLLGPLYLLCPHSPEPKQILIADSAFFPLVDTIDPLSSPSLFLSISPQYLEIGSTKDSQGHLLSGQKPTRLPTAPTLS